MADIHNEIQPELPQKMPINSGKLVIKSLEITDLSVIPRAQRTASARVWPSARAAAYTSPCFAKISI